MNNTVSNKSFLSSLFSPAVSLAVLGTGAFVFSFYRAGQLADLVLPKGFSRSPSVHSLASTGTKIDVNSLALLTAIDKSIPARLAGAGDSVRAKQEALKNLTDNSPTDVANIALAGEIFAAMGDKEEKEMGFALLAQSVVLAPDNHYLACRYAERMAVNGHLDQAAQQLSELVKNHSELKGIHLVLAKIYFVQNKTKEALDHLNQIKDGQEINAKDQEEAALLFVKMGKTFDGYKLFRMAMSDKPAKRFYAAYCGESLGASVEDYKTALAIVEANLNNNPSADQLALQIKQAVLLLFLDRAKEAKDVLGHAFAAHKDNFDLQVLLAAANFAAHDSDPALSYLELAAKTYQPKI